ncbi:MAG TPA: heme ABC exporter ATP-binding protein CcmA [Stellaceae bacterium]|nr:heme ABC exporter ATP-binding protein CcmA [Stellaceae bacterium]
MTQAANALFNATNLACRRGGRLVFSGLHFALPPGRALILRGPNGSGKSSLLRLLAGLGRPESGRIAWGGETISDDSAAHRARLHFIGHADAVKPALLVGETLAFWAGLHGGGADDVTAALAHFRLERLADMPCRFLSAGERKRLALARLLASPAALWLLDEPTNGLDAAALEDLLRAISDHCAGGGIALIASHLPLTLDRVETLALDDYTPRGRALAA